MKLDKNLILGKTLLIIGLVFVIISLIKFNQPYFWVYFLIGYLIALYGAYLLGKSKNYKNPFKTDTPKDLVKTSLLVGVSGGIVVGIFITKSLIGMLIITLLSIVVWYFVLYIYEKIRKKKK